MPLRLGSQWLGLGRRLLELGGPRWHGLLGGPRWHGLLAGPRVGLGERLLFIGITHEDTILPDSNSSRESFGVVTSREYDHLVEKTLPSAFTGTDLADWLAARDVDTIVIAGYMTQMCDESTARDALHRGLTVEFLSDATGTLAMANRAGSVSAENLHRAVLVVLQSRFATVATTGEWIDAIGGGAPLEPSNIFASTEVGRAAAV